MHRIGVGELALGVECSVVREGSKRVRRKLVALQPLDLVALAERRRDERVVRRCHCGAKSGQVADGAVLGALLGLLHRGTAIAITSSPDKADRLKDVGADEVVLAKGNYQNDIMEVTGGHGADVVIDNVGAPTFNACFRALARGGRYVFTGQVGRQKMELYPAFIFGKECVITGSATTRMAEFLECMDLAEQGKLKPVVQQYPLAEIAQAFDDMDNRRIFGRAVLVP